MEQMVFVQKGEKVCIALTGLKDFKQVEHV